MTSIDSIQNTFSKEDYPAKFQDSPITHVTPPRGPSPCRGSEEPPYLSLDEHNDESCFEDEQSWRMGDRALYHASDGEVLVTIAKIHFDDGDLYFIVCPEDGHEKQTTRERLSGVPYEYLSDSDEEEGERR